MRSISLPDGRLVPVLGLGTWRMGEVHRSRAAEVAALRHAFDLGYRLVDTAEMYGEGGAEEVVGQALSEALRSGVLRREEVFIVSKVYPHNASRRGLPAACARSLRRLGLDSLDCYLLHWAGSQPLAETVEAFESLHAQGRIGGWGVSNFDTDDMAELWQLDAGPHCATDQVYYSLTERGPDHDLLPWLQSHGLPLMAYSPIDQGRLAGEPALTALAERAGLTPAQLGLAWCVSRPGVIAIPKAVHEAHLRENLRAATVQLDAATLSELDRHFPPPNGKSPLAMI